jgi:ribose transport system permease protein
MAKSISLIRKMAGGGATAASALLCVMFVIYVLHEPSALSLFGIGGELVLSGPGVIAIANVVVATTSTGTLGSGGSLAAVLAIGAAVGCVNGFMVAYLKLQSLAVSLGTLIACQGIALLILPAPGGEVSDAIVNTLSGDFYGIPAPAIVLTSVGGLWLLLKHSRMGMWLYAVGTDEQASRLSGLNVRTTKLFAFVVSGMCYAMAGYVYCAEIGSGDPRISDSFLLFMYAAVAIGGTSLNGGRGGVLGTLAGAGILTILQKMLFALGVADFYTNIFNGIIMILAIFFGQLSALLTGAQRLRKA